MDEAAVSVTGQYYRALSGHRDELVGTSYELYTDSSVRPTSGPQSADRQVSLAAVLLLPARVQCSESAPHPSNLVDPL